MTTIEIKKLVSENASLKQLLQQKERKMVSIKKKADDLRKEKKAMTCRLERSKQREKALKSALVEDQKKTSDST
jgi:hypothetical protein